MFLRVFLMAIILIFGYGNISNGQSKSKSERAGEKSARVWEKTKEKSKETWDKTKQNAKEFNKGWQNERQKINQEKKRKK